MKKIMILMIVVGSFWAGLVWADMERVSVPEVKKGIQDTHSAHYLNH
jgi:hypothetical protein